MSRQRKVLVVGSGGREHALACALLASPSVGEVIVNPGNAGTTRAVGLHRNKSLRNAVGKPLDVARELRPDLVVVGPEVPLCDGLVDALRENGLCAYGPTKAAAQLEGSKAFMKAFVRRYGIPSADYVVVDDPSRVVEAVERFAAPPVVKADGLCAGKGVVVASTHAQAIEAAQAMLSGQAFGDAGRRVVLEERLLGQEVSVQALCDGQQCFLLPPAQDHKRVGEGDVGPNTGGMGSYGPVPLVSPALLDTVHKDIVQPVLAGMSSERSPFVGTLFAGLMIDSAGCPKVLEFNVRFGDPETQVVLDLLDGDLAEALHTAALGALDCQALRFTTRHALCVVLAAQGYPGQVRTGDPITGLESLEDEPHISVYHAGTARADAGYVTSGGRVLGVTGRGESLVEAADRAYRAVQSVHFSGRHYRRDIGHWALQDQASLRSSS